MPTEFQTPFGNAIVGTPEDDTLASPATGHDLIFGLGGDDTITAHGGDTVFAGSGNDTIHVESLFGPGGALPDPVTAFGGPGNDVFTETFIGRGIGAPLTAFGGPGDDTFVDILGTAFGGPGDDTFMTRVAGTFTGGPGHDTYILGFGAGGAVSAGGVVTDFDEHDTIRFAGTPISAVMITQTTLSSGGETTRIAIGSTAAFTLEGHYDQNAFVVTPVGTDVTVTYDPHHDPATPSDWHFG